MTGWSEDRVEILKKCWSGGLSASQCAARLGGVTRNAVIGKVHRLGLPGRATTSKLASGRRMRRVPGNSPIRAKVVRERFRFGAGTGAFVVAAPPARIVMPLPEPPASLHVALLDLREGQCRWPIGDPRDAGFHFCGHERRRGPYCDHHMAAGTQPVRGRSR